MKSVEAIGLGEYQISGEREEEAAAAFQEGYAACCGASGDGDSMLWELRNLRRQIIEDYGVEITLV
jgi:hypothetical protein